MSQVQVNVPSVSWTVDIRDCHVLLRKEVIQPHLPVRLPCYDLVPVTSLTLNARASLGTPDFHDLTGGVYKAREHIHRGMLIRDY